MSLPRSSAKPITCRIGAGVTAALANKHYAVALQTDVANDIYEHPTATLCGDADNAVVRGELLEVDVANGLCSVLVDGLMYMRLASGAYSAAMNGFRVVGLAAGNAGEVGAGAAAIARGPIIEGGGSVKIDGTDVNVVKARGG